MRYDIVLSPGARDVVINAPLEQQKAIIVNLGRLALAPVTLSRPGPTPPFVPGYQVYWFTVGDVDGRHQYTIQFKYMDNETELWIAGIGHEHLESGGP